MKSVTVERIRIRYGETDQMGHVYYGNYMLFFEQARAAWCRERGVPYKEIESMGYKLPCVEVWTKYRGEIKYDDVIAVRVWVEEARRAAIQFQYEIVNESSWKSVTEGYTWHVVVDETMKAVSIPPFIREMIEKEPESSDSA
ncbi:acyl-CoA thioesterase [bacterium]|jgi:acyl-CoA thioester hydrolase|nr:acyl-CoA thioesterase [bacterium]